VPAATARIEIAWSRSPADSAATLAGLLPTDAERAIPVVPSTLEGAHPAVAAVRNALRRHRLRTTQLVPRPAVTAIVAGRRRWQGVAIGDRTWRVDARLTANPYLAIAIIDDAHRAGPFVLDLPSHFLHPADRVRLLARPDRARLVADLAGAAPPAGSLVLAPCAGGWLSVTTRDPIAAELWALALAERYHDARLEMTGPWEDATVQRATELELGVRISAEMTVAVAGDALPPEAAEKVADTGRRLGLDLAAWVLRAGSS
jgi:hypothetical protein